jgi:hypothetical protein
LPEPALAAQSVARVLQPLARLMIDHGLQLPSMMELLKEALVGEAERTYALADKGSSDTRIALLTGVHRKDVKRLRGSKVGKTANGKASNAGLLTANPIGANVTANVAAKAESAPDMPIAASVVARWISEPRFLNADHTPRPLGRTPSRGNVGAPDFTTLVAEVSTDLGARAVLDELVRLGVVALTEDGNVTLKSAAFVPKEGLSESFAFLSANVSDHLAASVHNMSPHRVGPAMLEQSAYSSGLSADQADALQKLARRLWAQSLQQFLQMATVAEQRSENAPGPKYRVRYGTYFYDAPVGEAVANAPPASLSSSSLPPASPSPVAKATKRPGRKPATP